MTTKIGTTLPVLALAASISGLFLAALPSYGATPVPPELQIAVAGASVTIDSTETQTCNVGRNGSATGLVNNQSYTLLQLLQQVNPAEANGTFNADASNTIFNDINTTGDIN